MESPWHLEPEALLRELGAQKEGLTDAEAAKRLKQFGKNIIKEKKKQNLFLLFLSQFKSPFVLILLFAALFSLILKERLDALIIFIIVVLSGILGFIQEKSANDIIAHLLQLTQTYAMVFRSGVQKKIKREQIVPGDLIFLHAGDLIPADAILIEGKDLFVDEATLTGEPFGIEKEPGVIAANVPLSKRTNTVFMGTHVISGSAKAVVFQTGPQTELGKLSKHIEAPASQTSYEIAMLRFGYLLMNMTMLFVLIIFSLNLFLQHPLLESLFFALALAIGFTPQLLPMIISVNLAHGAKHMAQKKVIIKKLAAIENIGAMTLLCADKTGTLTKGIVQLYSAVDLTGKESERSYLFAYLNASFQTGYTNPLDSAILKHNHLSLEGWQKLDEIPYDFIRKRLSIMASHEKKSYLITKGAVPNILSICSQVEIGPGRFEDIGKHKASLETLFENWGHQGFRVLGLAYRILDGLPRFTKEDEKEMIFLGFLLFFDPPKPDVEKTLKELMQLGIHFKMITGDNRYIAGFIAQKIGVINPQVLTGEELSHWNEAQCLHQMEHFDVFAEIEPNQKEHIIQTLRKKKYVVGYLGDGINDLSALHAADVGISVDSAVDFLKERAEIVLLDKNLSHLLEGVKEGRKTFVNTLKYILTATSSNFGNMFSMAGASLFLPFLPLLPTQILLNNLLTDLSEMTIVTDNVDLKMIEQPKKWDMKVLKKFMIAFGLTSSVFDYVTFGALFFILQAAHPEFRTAWFIESVISASGTILIIRTYKPSYKGHPSKPLFFSIMAVSLFVIFLPLTKLSLLFDLVPLPWPYFVAIFFILAGYFTAIEWVKRKFYKTRLQKML